MADKITDSSPAFQVAVVGITVWKESTLLLKRNKPPLNWCPPCGRVEEGESLREALEREITEETGLPVYILEMTDTWEGMHCGIPLKSYTFVCQALSNKVVLSHEHSAFRWVKIKDLKKWDSKTDFDLSRWEDYLIKSFPPKKPDR